LPLGHQFLRNNNEQNSGKQKKQRAKYSGTGTNFDGFSVDTPMVV